jgi:hypothetical protein
MKLETEIEILEVRKKCDICDNYTTHYYILKKKRYCAECFTNRFPEKEYVVARRIRLKGEG